MQCPKCQFDNRKGAKFCKECGVKLELVCPKCSAFFTPDSKFCDECGQDLTVIYEAADVDYSAPKSYTPKFLADKILTSRSSIEGERKLVTILFADVANYTSISEKLDPEEVHQFMDGCFSILMDQIHKYEGTINQFTGDGVMAIFGAPLAHEDHAQRACYAALSIQKTLENYEERIKKDYGADFKMRIGLNSGPVVVGSIGDDLRMDYTAIGDTSNLASRIENMANPGTILVSSHSHKLTKDFFEFIYLDEIEVKGKEEPQKIFELIKAGEVNTRIGASIAKGLGRFVGRENSIEFLMQAFEKIQSGSGQIVGIIGEAGVGKSRLLFEFKKQLSIEIFTYLEGRCFRYGDSMVYLPVLDIFRSYFEIKDSDQAPMIKKKMEQKILQFGEELKGVLPAFYELLSLKVEDHFYRKLEPVQKREKAFEAMRDLLVRESQVRPIILVVEDLHWIDKTSEAFLGYLIEWLAKTRILLVLLYRPEYTHTWGSKSYYTKIGLTQLTSQSSAELIQAILFDCEIESGLEAFILNRSAGIPLYIEELTHSLLENETIQREQHQCFLGVNPKDIHIPDTIQGIIAARMDRLEDNTKRTMQVASVIGRSFAFRILQTVTGKKEELKSYLLNLQELEFIYEKNLFPELEYIFKHALTQEVAYNSLLAVRRKKIHEGIGEAIEQIYAERLEEYYEKLAYHYDRAEVWDKAFLYLSRSGNKARLAFASQEALTSYSRAIEISSQVMPALKDKELLSIYEGRGLIWLLVTDIDKAISDFQMMLQMARESGNRIQEGESLIHLAFAHSQKFSEEHIPFVEQYAQEAMQLAHQTRDQQILAKSLSSLGLVYQARGELQKADRNLEESLKISRREGFKEASSQSVSFLGLQAYWQGDFKRAVSFGREGLAICREIHDGFHEQFNYCNLAFAHWGIGDYKEAFRILHHGLKVAKERTTGAGAARMMNTLGWLHSEFGDVAQGMEYNQESAELGRTYGASNIEISALINLGLDHLLIGQHDRALYFLDSTLDRVQREAFGAHRWRWKIRLLVGLAEVHNARGAYRKALRYIEQGLKEAQATSSQKYVAKGRYLRGKILAQMGDTESAGSDLKRAHKIAERLGCPAISYPIASELGQWHEKAGQMWEAAVLYGMAKAAARQMATNVEDEALSKIFLQTALVQEIYECSSRLGSKTANVS